MKNRFAVFRVGVSFAAFMLAVTYGGGAAADGGNPRAYGILFDPGEPSHFLIQSEYWGLFDERGNNSSSLLCSQAFGARALDQVKLRSVLGKGGRILVAGEFAGLVVTDDNCTWKKIDAFDGAQVYAIAPIDAGLTSFVAITTKNESGPVVSRVYSSMDRGDTWTKLAGALPQNFSARDVAVAPSDASRIYVVGVVTENGPRQLATSVDGGATFTIQPLASMDQYDPRVFAPLSVVGVDPRNPDVVFVRADSDDGVIPPVPDELWVTSDAGKTWRKPFVPTNDLPGFTYSPDGTEVMVASPVDGIKAAPVADAIAGNAAAFHQVFSGQVWGIAAHDGKLYAGTDDFGMKPPFMVGVSTDGGTTFTALMDHCHVSFPTCAADSSMETACREQWERPGGYVTDYLQSDECIASLGMGGTGGTGGTGGALAPPPVGGAGGMSAVTPPGVGTGGLAPSTGGASAATNGDDVAHVRVSSASCAVVAPRRRSAVATWSSLLVLVALRSRRRRRDPVGRL